MQRIQRNGNGGNQRESNGVGMPCIRSQAASAARASARREKGPSSGPPTGERSAFQRVPSGSTREARRMLASPSSRNGVSISSNRKRSSPSGAILSVNAGFGGLVYLPRRFISGG